MEHNRDQKVLIQYLLDMHELDLIFVIYTYSHVSSRVLYELHQNGYFLRKKSMLGIQEEMNEN